MTTDQKKTTLTYEHGSILIENLKSSIAENKDVVVYDPRILKYRTTGANYKKLIIQLKAENCNYSDFVRKYNTLKFANRPSFSPREHQQKALDHWVQNEMRGVVSLPTGAGKTFLAVLAIYHLKRSTLIIVPTIDLLHQWHKVLSDFFDCKIGRLGGGFRDYQNILVSTYDSARMAIEAKGNLFGFLIADECHHLPAMQNRIIAQCCIAPFRMGLSATVERSDGEEKYLYEIMGKKVYEASIGEMVKQDLAPYDIINIKVKLNSSEQIDYNNARNLYLAFIKQQQIPISQKHGWQQFIIQASRSPQGRAALHAYQQQKKIAQEAKEKFNTIWSLLNKHAFDPLIIFTDNNDMAYKIGRMFLLPVITHQTKAKERALFLQSFREKKLKVLVTSRVLNEGVDVPEARVAIVASGTGSVREHVQRLGRILRNIPGKRAVLYEIISNNTNETYINKRRKQHDAYQKTRPL